MKFTIKKLLIAALAAAALACYAEDKKFGDYSVSLRVDKPDGVYKKSEECTFTLKVLKKSEPVANLDVEWEISKDGVAPYVRGKTKTDAAGTARFSGRLDEPGFVRCTNYIAFPETPKRKNNVQAGAAVSPEEIKPSRPAPEDFVQYWQAQKKILAAIPMNIKLTPVDSKSDKVAMFDVQADGFNGKLSGYLAYPKGAADKSLPAIVTCHGAGVRSSYGVRNSHPAWSPVKWAEMGFIALDFNALGLPNGEPRKFYDDLQNTSLKNYYLKTGGGRDDFFFRELYMRLMRAMDVVTAQPQWDGKILVVGGRSQGGGQAFAAAGLNDKVTFMFSHIAAMCDQTGMLAGRANGWPRDLSAVRMTSREKLDFKRSIKGGKVKPGIAADGVDAVNEVKWDMRTIEAARYFDAVNFAALIKADAFVSVGFCDKICPPTTVYAAYNNIPSKNKKMYHGLNFGHAADKPSDAAAEAAVMEHVKKMKTP